MFTLMIIYIHQCGVYIRKVYLYLDYVYKDVIYIIIIGNIYKYICYNINDCIVKIQPHT